MSDSIPILFDTDIGSDIDDAVALAYLLKQTRCELVGITTVTGDTRKRAALAEIVCRAGGRTDIPIHAGLERSLLFGPGQPEVPQFEAVADQPHRTDYDLSAIDFLRATIRSRPHQLTLLAVGPMTNIGALFAADPATALLLKNLVLMCGVYTGNAGHGPGATEWNADRDPIATALTYKFGSGKLLGVGLDVTQKCQLSADECRKRFVAAGGALGVVGRMAEVWFRHSPQITFHDPLAAALVFEPTLCEYATGTVTVLPEGGPLAGLTRWRSGGDAPPHRIAVTVDPTRFFEHYFGVTGG
ncbi:MAG: nucleoside hydrolase [Capsulimonadales bacterium]|nr:nucleoside hydrolase [Capsulimonadales bacterium]